MYKKKDAKCVLFLLGKYFTDILQLWRQVWSGR